VVVVGRRRSFNLSAVILLSVAFMDSPKLWLGVSVAATSSKLEKVGPGQRRVTARPEPIFSVRRDSK